MKRELRIAVLCVILGALLAIIGCGGGKAKTSPQFPKRTVPVQVHQPENVTVCSGTIDKCQTLKLTPSLKFSSPRGLIPDVSSYQGHPNWQAAKNAGIAGAIVKLGEYRVDPDAAYNWSYLKRIHLWHAGYWFVRNTGCANEGQQIVNEVRSLGGLDSGPVFYDVETPEARGYLPCLDSVVYKALHRHGAAYTAPGTYPGGSHDGLALWQATYGSGFSAFWRPVIAWQCSDGVNGCVTYVPGVGFGDVSVNYGATKLVPVVHKPKPIPPRYWSACSRLDNIHFWHQHHPLGAGQKDLSRRLRKDLKRAAGGPLGCSAPPHSYPYHYPYRKGALA